MVQQQRLELLAIFQEVKMEHSRFSSDVNQLLCWKLNWTVMIFVKGWGRNPSRKHWRTLLSMTEAPQCSRNPGDFIRPQPSICFQRKFWMTCKGNKWKIMCFISIGLWIASVFLKKIIYWLLLLYLHMPKKPSEGKIRDRWEWKMQKELKIIHSAGGNMEKTSKYELAHHPRHHVLKREWIGVKRKQF